MRAPLACRLPTACLLCLVAVSLLAGCGGDALPSDAGARDRLLFADEDLALSADDLAVSEVDLAMARCDDGAHNGDETDEDCGGSCPVCALTRMCRINNDCASHLCRMGRCAQLTARTLAFAAPAEYAAMGGPRGIVAADFDADGTLDLAVGLGDKASFGVLGGAPGGRFKDMVSYPSGNLPWNITAGDFDKDGRVDVAVPDYQGGVFVSLQRNGAFPAAVKYAMPDGTYRLGTADLDGDGDLDLTVGHNTGASWLPNRGNGMFDARQGLAAGFTFGIGAGDLNGDGITDVVFSGMNGLSVVPGSRQGMLTASWTSAAVKNASAVSVFDLDGNGRLDFTVVALMQGLVPFLAEGKGSFRNGPAIAGGVDGADSATRADFNFDGWDDLAWCNAQGRVAIVLGNGRGGFTATTPLFVGMGCYGITAADLDKDGLPDLAVSVRNPDPPAVKVLLNQSR